MIGTPKMEVGFRGFSEIQLGDFLVHKAVHFFTGMIKK